MKQILLSCALLMSAFVSNAQTQLNVADKPLSDGLLKFYSTDYYYFNMDKCDFSKEYNVYNEANELVGTVMADSKAFTGYAGSMSVGYFRWTITEPGTYTLEIPENSFIFDDFADGEVGNAAINAPVTIFEVSEFTVSANLSASDVQYVEDLDGIVLTFDGAKKVELGSYASVSFNNEEENDSYAVASWASYGGTADIDGVQVTLNGVTNYGFEEELTKVKVIINGNQLGSYGLYGWIVDGVDITADIEFYLTDEVSSLGLPIYKADMSNVLDLQGRNADPSHQGLKISNGKVIMVK